MDLPTFQDCSASVAPAGAGLSGHCPGISAHYNNLNVLHELMYTVSVDVTWHVAIDYGGVKSTSRALRHEASTAICVCPGYY